MGNGDDESDFDEKVQLFFARFDALVAENPREALVLLDAAASDIRDLDEWVIGRSDVIVALDGRRAAAIWLEALLEDCPGFADAHYCLAGHYEALEEQEQAIGHRLETLRLDSAADELAYELDGATLERIASAAGAAIHDLPVKYRQLVSQLPVFLEARPSEQVVRDGFDPRALGLFTGGTHAERGTSSSMESAPSITLYTHCLWDAYGLDERELLEEVRITVLHEVGHYLGLDEDELETLGLG